MTGLIVNGATQSFAYPVLPARGRDRCSRRKCKWSGTDNEKETKQSADLSTEFGIAVNVLCCPRCGSETFYPCK